MPDFFRKSTPTFLNIVFYVLWVISAPAVAEQLAFVNATIIDGQGGPPLNKGSVVIDSSRIVAVGKSDEVNIPPTARLIDVSGKSLLPGLADMHVHLMGGWDGVSVDMLGYQRYLNAALYAGVTTVLDTGNVMPYILQMRNEINTGRINGPRIFSVGSLIDGPDTVWPPIATVMASKQQAAGIVKLLDRAGVDAYKVYSGLSIPQVGAVVTAAKETSKPVIADLWQRNGSYDLTTTGIDAYGHIPNRHIESIELEAVVKNDTAFITTLAVKESFSRRRNIDLAFLDHPLIADTVVPKLDSAFRRHATKELSEQEQAFAEHYGQGLDNSMANADLLNKAGVMLVAGTDAPYPGVLLGEGIHRELELLVQAGLSPLQAISAATSNAARLLGQDDWGTIAAGKRADLVVVDGRPDRHISDTRNIEMVIREGAIINRDALRFDSSKDPGFDTGNPVDSGDM